MRRGARVVIIAGGSFQGKSMVALEVAARFRFSAVLSTDSIRNILKVLNPDEAYLATSTYLLPEALLHQQMEIVSEVARQALGIYEERGEHLVLEGMHFSETFLHWASSQPFHRICLDNSLPLRQRILYKKVTRSRLSWYDPVSSERTVGIVDETNVDMSSYMKHQARIAQIHRTIVGLCAKHGFEVIEFADINDGIARAIASIDAWASSADDDAC